MSTSGEDVVATLDHLRQRRGCPKRIQVDNGPEFISMALDHYAYDYGITLDYSCPGKPTDNPFIESFNGSLRDECLNTHWFLSLADARKKPVHSLDGLQPLDILCSQGVESKLTLFRKIKDLPEMTTAACATSTSTSVSARSHRNRALAPGMQIRSIEERIRRTDTRLIRKAVKLIPDSKPTHYSS